MRSAFSHTEEVGHATCQQRHIDSLKRFLVKQSCVKYVAPAQQPDLFTRVRKLISTYFTNVQCRLAKSHKTS